MSINNEYYEDSKELHSGAFFCMAKKMYISLSYSQSRAFFYWAMQYGSNIEVLEHESMRERIKQTSLDVYKKYN